ncbi:hypothetical protein ACFVIM_30925 [Streptomyces sp. NPDC057638]|uniref:hypothetical protein n=1 Tax=Streptomyces sp. NPDC057638 TaxID=3346190 RepID=UPI00368346E7
MARQDGPARSEPAHRETPHPSMPRHRPDAPHASTPYPHATHRRGGTDHRPAHPRPGRALAGGCGAALLLGLWLWGPDAGPAPAPAPGTRVTPVVGDAAAVGRPPS